jgi:hypothetical protein
MINKPGIYYLPTTDKLCVLTDIERYEDLTSDFIILTWHYSEELIYKKTLITKNQYKMFRWICEL